MCRRSYPASLIVCHLKFICAQVTLKINNYREEFRYNLCLYYEKGENYVEARRIYCLFADEWTTVSKLLFENSLWQFKGVPRSEKLSGINEDKISALLRGNQYYTMRDMAHKFNW